MSGLFGGGQTSTNTTTTNTDIKRMSPWGYSLNTGTSSLVATPKNAGTPGYYKTVPISPGATTNGAQINGGLSIYNPGMWPNTSGFGTQQVWVPGTSGSNANVAINLDPAIRALTMGSASNAQIGYRRAVNDINMLQSNRSPFIQARVDPLLASTATQQGALERSMAQRGIYGSLSQQSMNSFNRSAQQQIADQRALATNDSLNAALAAEATARGYNQDVASNAQQILAQELAKLGLGQQAIDTMINSQLPMNSGGQNTTTTQKQPTDILGGIGSIASAIGAFL